MIVRAHLFILILAALAGWLLVVITAKAQTPITFAEWIAGFALSSENSHPLADPDGDGLVNLLEFAIAGRNPTVPDSNYPNRVIFGQRTGNALPASDPSVITEVSAAAVQSLSHFHPGWEYSIRPNIKGVVILPEYSRVDWGLNKWVNGRSAVMLREKPGDPTKMQAWALALTDRAVANRFFWRLRVKFIDDI